MAAGARKPFVAGNWKMNGLKASARELKALAAGLAKDTERGTATRCEVWICPPATLLSVFAPLAKGTKVLLGGQDCHKAVSGAHTGDISAEMLKDAGARAVIVGHSERRQDHGETDARVRAKAEAARRAGLLAIVCVGETEAERDAGRTEAVVSAQLQGSLPDGTDAGNTVIAYEPVWAIGTGRTPTSAEVVAVHATIRSGLKRRFGPKGEGIRILYGGSVKPSNARELLGLDGVDGALVGGASLLAKDFLEIVRVYARKPKAKVKR